MRLLTRISLLIIAAWSTGMCVDGIAVSVHSTYTHAFGWAFGNIEKFTIVNSVPSAGTALTSGSNARCANISPDGTRVGFIRNDGKICVVSMNGGPVTALASIPNDAWIDWPANDWIYYTNRWQGNELWRVNTSGTPAPALVATGLGSAMQLSIATSLTRGTAVTCCYSARSFNINGSSIQMVTDNGGCGPGISPSGNYFTNNQGDHASVIIRNFNGSQLHSWRTNTSLGGTNWNRNRWSANSDDWVTFTQGTPYQQENGHHQVLYRKDGTQGIAVQPYSAGSYYEGDDFWVGTAGPSIRLSKDSLGYSANIGGANPASQTITVTNGGGGSLPALTVSENASWLAATVGGTTITNAVTIAGLSGNVYTTTVTVSGSGVTPASYTVMLRVVAPPALSSVTVSPSTAYVAPSATKQFSAAGLDQYGAVFALTGVQWAVSGGGTISQTGLFTAGSAEGGPYAVTATTGGKSDTASVQVAATPPVEIRINCGGAATGAWTSAVSYVTGGSDYDFGVTPALTGLSSPASADVYRTVRHEDHRYSFAAVPNGSYTVRIHFVDQNTGNRKMNYAIEGVSVLTDFNVVTAAGGTNKPIIREFAATVSDNNGLQIVCSKGTGDDVFEAGIEVLSVAGPVVKPTVRILSPNGGETYKTGDRMTISWEWDTTVHGGAAVWLSVDDGIDWTILSTVGSIPAYAPGTNRGSFEWTVTRDVGGVSTASATCRIRVWEYSLNNLVDVSDRAFTITNNTAVATAASPGTLRAPGAVVRFVSKNELEVSVAGRGAHTVSLVSLDGKIKARQTGFGPDAHTLSAGGLTGVCVVRVFTDGRVYNQRVTIAR